MDGEENYEMLTSRHDMAIALTNLQLLCYLHKILPAKIPARMRRSTPNIMPNLSRGTTDNLCLKEGESLTNTHNLKQ